MIYLALNEAWNVGQFTKPTLRWRERFGRGLAILWWTPRIGPSCPDATYLRHFCRVRQFRGGCENDLPRVQSLHWGATGMLTVEAVARAAQQEIHWRGTILQETGIYLDWRS